MKTLILNDEEISCLLNFLPEEEEVPEGLDPTFYHTLNYEGDVALQDTANSIRDKIEQL